MKSLFLFSARFFMCKSLVLLFGLFAGQVANAQQITPFVKGGLGFSDWSLSEDSDPNTGMLPAFNLGVYGEINVHPSIFISSGLQFYTMGARVKFSDSNSPKFSMSYISIPVFGRLQMNESLSMYFGPKAGLLLSAKEKESDGYKRDVKTSFKNGDISLEGGLSYLLPSGVELGVYLTHGLTNVYDAGDTKIHNCGMGINARYNISIPKS